MNRNKGGTPPDVGSNLLSFVSPDRGAKARNRSS